MATKKGKLRVRSKGVNRVREELAGMDREQLLTIDSYRLDEEWIGQPKLFLHYAEMLAHARMELEECKSHFELVVAELDNDIRSEPENFGIEKATETAIRNLMIRMSKYHIAQSEVRDAKHKVDVLQACVTALDHRKRALENLVSLYGMQYFADPRAPTNSRTAIEEVEKKAARRRGKGKQ